MKKYFCDLCNKEIKPADIHVNADLRAGDRVLEIDMHSTCWYTFIRELRKLIEEDERL